MFLVRVSVVIVSGSGRCGEGGERRLLLSEFAVVVDVVVVADVAGFMTGDAEFDVCEDAG